MNLKYLQYKGYIGTVELDTATAKLHGRMLNIPSKFKYDLYLDSYSPYYTIEDNFKQVVDWYEEECAKQGKVPETPSSGNLEICITPELHAAALNFARERDIDISQLVSLALSRMLGTDNPNLLPSDHYLRHTQTVRPQAVGIRVIA